MSAPQKKIIITCAVTGAAQAGASIVHLPLKPEVPSLNMGAMSFGL